jgi:CBS domain-containing protein
VVADNAPLDEVAHVMLDAGTSAVAVVDANGELRGVIAESDFAPHARHFPFTDVTLPEVFGQQLLPGEIDRVYQRAARRKRAGEVMRPAGSSLDENTSVYEAISYMTATGSSYVVVVRAERPVGMLTHHDLLRLVVWDGVQE